MLKHLTIAFVLFSFFGQSQKVTTDEFKQFVGHWHGSLTYQDESEDRPTILVANIDVVQIGNTDTLLFSYDYPREPAVNYSDTIVLLKGGKMMGEEKVVVKVITQTNGLIIMTKTNGVDGIDNKRAQILHTYILENNTLVIRKDIKFKGQKEAINRAVWSFDKKH